jgi:CheY-like chemotaxis protein
MDGLEAARRIRAEDSPAIDPQVPIIALTAHAMDQDRQRSLAAGMDDHASKPIDSETIAEILARHVGRHGAGSHPATRTPAAGPEPVHLVPTVRI